MNAKKKFTRTSISIKTKLKIIDELKNGADRKSIQNKFNVSRYFLSKLNKNKENIENILISNNTDKFTARKRLKWKRYSELDNAVIRFIKRIRKNNLPVSGEVIKDRAQIYAKQLGFTNFKASSGWLEKFNKRNGLCSKKLCGESADADITVANEYKNNILPEIIKNYHPNNIFNADETALFYKCMPNRTMTFRNEKCFGGKFSKERVTILLGANMSGTEKLKLLVIGKSKSPRCFKNIKELPVMYKNNLKSWMTSAIFLDWLHVLDKKFSEENRKILLIIDNCPAHPKNADIHLTSKKFNSYLRI